MTKPRRRRSSPSPTASRTCAGRSSRTPPTCRISRKPPAACRWSATSSMRMIDEAGLATAAGGTIDPQINYTLQYWQLYQSIYDGLVSFKHAPGSDGFTIVPDLAESIPPPADDGKSYTFKLRKGIKFS